MFNIKNPLKYFTMFLFISSIGICNSWSMIEEKDTSFNPNPKVWYRVVNKEKLFENNREQTLGGPFLDANPQKERLHCVQSSSNNSLMLWRFKKTEDGHYKIINRFREEKCSPKMIYTPGNNSIRLTNGEIGNKVKWSIIKADDDKDEITPQFYFIINEDGTLLRLAQNNCINSTVLEENENNKFKWMFFKEK